jgi:hypothetical protein
MLNSSEKQAMIDTLRCFPAELETLVAGLSRAQLDAVPLPGVWSVQQIVHHLADSHMNSVIRLKLILTVDHPTLVGYPQDEWAVLPDVQAVPIQASLDILRGLHLRWVALFESLTPEQWTRTGFHTENGDITPEDLLPVYASHCRDHLAQIREVLAAAG